MAITRAEALTRHFYEWEQRGRGWMVYPQAIQLEPPFERFHHQASMQEVKDDGIAPSLFMAPFHKVAKLLSSFRKSKQEESEETNLQAKVFTDNHEQLDAFTISFPKGSDIQAEPMEQLLIMLSNCRYPVSFEITASAQSIRIQIVSRNSDTAFIQSQLKSFFPEGIVRDTPEAILDIIDNNTPIRILDLGLCYEFMCPIAMTKHFKLDPLTGLFGVLDLLHANDTATIQILFQGVSHAWAQSIMTSVSDHTGACFFEDAPEMLDLAREKVSSPLFAVTLRVIGQSRNQEDANAMAEQVAQMLIQTTQSPDNSLGILEGYQEEWQRDDVLLRTSHRIGMLFNTRELMTFAHFPSPSVVTAKLERDTKKTKVAPDFTRQHEFVLGYNYHQGWKTPVTLSSEQRLRHTHIIGATGTGKSTLLLNLITQDIRQGRGVAVIDPHGDLIESIASHIPPERIQDVVWIDPSDTEYPVGFNILTAHSEIEKEVLSSDLVSVFRRLSTSWGDQMNSVLANAILAFLESTQGGTLMDLRRFLVEKDFREHHLKTVTDPHILYYWQKEYPLLKSTSIGPILTRLDTFLRPKPIRYMVAQQKGLDFEDILDNRKILLIKLSQGLVGEENSYILGTTFVSKIYQAAMARQAKAKEDRNDFFLYIDEFQNFITPSMAAILSGARKYHLGLVLAHQDMQQLTKSDTELASAVTSNAGTRICFRLGDTDAKRFERGFSYFEATDLQNLNTGEAIVRVERTENDFNLSIEPLQDKNTEQAESIRKEIIYISGKRYGTPRSEVEKLLEQLLPTQQEPQTITQQKTTEEKPEIPSRENTKTPEITETIETLQQLDEEKIAKTKARLIEQKALSQHRYLQTLIKKMAEARGYIAKIEEPTPDGQGRVDVLLERNGKRVACEIGVTTTKEWELHNIEKCLNAGYETIVAIASDTNTKQLMQRQVAEKLHKKQAERVLVMEADVLFQYLDAEVLKESGSEKRIKGYRVKVEYEDISEQEMGGKRQIVTKLLFDSGKKRMKNKD